MSLFAGLLRRQNNKWIIGDDAYYSIGKSFFDSASILLYVPFSFEVGTLVTGLVFRKLKSLTVFMKSTTCTFVGIMRYFLQLAYRGTNYHGWQRQPNGLSVQEVLETALSTVLRQSITIVGSGRTDAGVHAAGQFAHFETDATLPAHLLRSTNSLIPPDIAVYDCFPVRSDDHARYSATFRYYQYQISRRKDPFRENLVYIFTLPLNVARMNEAAERLLHHTDFESFSKVKTDVRTFDCRIDWAYWEQKPNGDLVFHIRANRFLHGMVRAIVGTLLAVGQERLSVDDFDQIILARDRKRAGRAAPAEGLSLVEVGYPDEVFTNRMMNDE